MIDITFCFLILFFVSSLSSLITIVTIEYLRKK